METDMDSKILASALFAISLSAAGAAYAQPIGTVPGDPYVLGQHPAVKGYVPLEVQMRRSNREERRRQYEENPDGSAFGRQHEYYRARGRGVGPDYAYYQGDRLPYEYRHRNYVVNDWRAHRLSAPPNGYHWVQSGNDYILVAIATGIIAQILLSH